MAFLKQTLAAAAVMTALVGSARADVYNDTFSVFVAEGIGSFDTASAANPYTCGGANAACATFTYGGPIDFSNTNPQNFGRAGDLNRTFGFSAANISGYTGAGTVAANGGQVANYGSLSSFLDSSGSAGNFAYGSYYVFNLGTVVAGTVLTITHDDGVALFENNTELGPTVSGPTSAVTDTVRVGTTGTVQLYYSRQNGTPSVLDVNIPEPVSAAIVGAGLVGVGLLRRRRA